MMGIISYPAILRTGHMFCACLPISQTDRQRTRHYLYKRLNAGGIVGIVLACIVMSIFFTIILTWRICYERQKRAPYRLQYVGHLYGVRAPWNR